MFYSCLCCTLTAGNVEGGVRVTLVLARDSASSCNFRIMVLYEFAVFSANRREGYPMQQATAVASLLLEASRNATLREELLRDATQVARTRHLSPQVVDAAVSALTKMPETKKSIWY